MPFRLLLRCLWPLAASLLISASLLHAHPLPNWAIAAAVFAAGGIGAWCAARVLFGESEARLSLDLVRASVRHTVTVKLSTGAAKQAELDGARLPSAEFLRREFPALVFTPDRLAVVKSGPAARRAYFDRVFGRLQPARASLSAEYGGAVAQRNAALRRASAGLSSREAIAPWTERVATLGAELVAAREEVLHALLTLFAERAAELGLEGALLTYEGDAPSTDELNARLDRDLERGATSLGPHLDDVRIAAGGRDLRSYGSQGEQRVTVLSLLLAEAELLTERRAAPPLLLLDDVLSELDPERRQVLVARVSSVGQTLVTATQRSALPGQPAQLLEVSRGVVKTA